MAKQGRRQYTDELRREAVKLVDEQGRESPEVTRSLEAHGSQVGRWRGQFGQGSGPSNGGGRRGDEAEALKRLRTDVQLRRLGREIRNKAAAFFALRNRTEVSVHRGGEGQRPPPCAVPGPGGRCPAVAARRTA